jgi:hypothetical protein
MGAIHEREAEAQGLPYVLAPRVLSRREWMERYAKQPPPIQVINDRTGRGVSDRGSGTPRAEVTRLGRPTRGHAVQQAPRPAPTAMGFEFPARRPRSSATSRNPVGTTCRRARWLQLGARLRAEDWGWGCSDAITNGPPALDPGRQFRRDGRIASRWRVPDRRVKQSSGRRDVERGPRRDNRYSEHRSGGTPGEQPPTTLTYPVLGSRLDRGGAMRALPGFAITLR